MGHKSVIYDGACTLCIRSKNTLIHLGLADKDRVWAYQEMPDKYISQVDYERFRNEMALIDLEGGATLYGPEAIIHLLSGKGILFRMLFSVGPLRRLFAFCYKIIALNRTVVMVPRLKKVRCASCEPDTPPEYRWFWIGAGVGTGLLISTLMGVYKQEDFSKPSFFLALLGLMFMLFLILKRSKENYLELLAHASSLFLLGMVLISANFFLMNIYGGSIPLSIWVLGFAAISFLVGKNYLTRAEYLQLPYGEKLLGGLMIGVIFLCSYLPLIY